MIVSVAFSSPLLSGLLKLMHPLQPPTQSWNAVIENKVRKINKNIKSLFQLSAPIYYYFYEIKPFVLQGIFGPVINYNYN